MFCPPANSTAVFIHLPSPVQSQPSTLFAFSQSSERKKRTGGREDIRRNTFELSARNREYFTRCIIWLDVPSFRGIYDRASLQRFGTAFLHIVQNSILPPLSRCLVFEISSSSHMRRTRRHVSFGDAATWGDLPAECRAREVSTLMQLYVYEVPEIPDDIFAIACTARPLRWLLG